MGRPTPPSGPPRTAADDPPCETCGPLAAPLSGEPDAGPLTLLVQHLYLCERLSTHEIARRTDDDRNRIARRLAQHNIPLRPRGAGGHRPARDPEGLAVTLSELYLHQNLTSERIGALLGLSDRTVRSRLAKYGIPRRGPGRKGCIDRPELSPADLLSLYVAAGLTADEVAERLRTSRGAVLRNAHEFGLPVRVGGPPPTDGPYAIELIDALYTDSIVSEVLQRHGIQRIPASVGRLRERFPKPVPLSSALLTDLYLEAGAATAHIELLTGQPVSTVRRQLRAAGIPVRSRGGRCPFIRRWKQAHSA